MRHVARVLERRTHGTVAYVNRSSPGNSKRKPAIIFVSANNARAPNRDLSSSAPNLAKEIRRQLCESAQVPGVAYLAAALSHCYASYP